MKKLLFVTLLAASSVYSMDKGDYQEVTIGDHTFTTTDTTPANDFAASNDWSTSTPCVYTQPFEMIEPDFGNTTTLDYSSTTPLTNLKD